MAPDAPQNGQDPKTQLLERLKAATNVLVTVSNSPSVDQLSAAIGLTLMLNKMGKHATAVFSGTVPSTIEFLQPEKTIEKTTDSLRDFIIALDKAKADKLRYKVEDTVVKIFITPYKSSLSEKDLEFSQGDFNVDAVVALGVHQQTDLDVAITAHGRILHDATIISVNNKLGGDLGSIHWLDERASSLSEMLASITDELKPGILDEQMSTALLTGIVAETDRFRNERTTPQTMSVSGKLMTAGANQQLIAAKLDGTQAIPQDVAVPVSPPAASTEPPKPDGALAISHDAPAPPTNNGLLDYSLHDKPGMRIDGDGMLHPDGTVPPPSSPPPPPPPSPSNMINSGQKLMLDPPTMGGTLTASYQTGGDSPPVNPMNLPQIDSPILNHDSPLSLPQASVTPPPPPPMPPLPTFSPPPPPPSAPIGDMRDDETLMEIEETVHSPHIQPTIDKMEAEQAQDSVLPPVEAARNAVNDAVADAPPPLEPLIALNSQPLGQELHQPEPLPPSSAPQPLPGSDVWPSFLPPAPSQSPPPPPPPSNDAWPSFLPPDNGPGPAPTDTMSPPSPPPPVPPPLPPMGV